MLHCGHGWRPTSVDRVIEIFPTSTRVATVSTDAGIGYLKGMGNPAGNESLAMELVGSEIAAQLGLPVPPFAVVELGHIHISWDGVAALDSGPAFISQKVQCMPSDGSVEQVSRLRHPDHISLLIMLDTWIRNLDRCPPRDYLDPTPRRDNLCYSFDGKKFDLVVIDQSHCFVEEDLESGLRDGNYVGDTRVYGFFPEFRECVNEAALRRAERSLTEIDANTIAEIVGAIPGQWGPSAAVRELWIEKIVARQGVVPGIVMDAILDQAHLNLGVS